MLSATFHLQSNTKDLLERLPREHVAEFHITPIYNSSS